MEDEVGLFSAYVSYRAGVKRGRRKAQLDGDLSQIPDELLEVCECCGYYRMRHDDDGRCPRYD